MTIVFVPINTNIPLYKQFPDENNIWENYKFVFSDSCKDADYTVVFDDLVRPTTIPTDKEHTVLFTCEPPSVKEYPLNYLQQFGHIFTCHEKLIKRGYNKCIPALPWMLLYDFYNKGSDYNKYNYFDLSFNLPRKDKLCVLTSNKRLSEGHCRRINFANKLKNALPDYVDIFGNGFNDFESKDKILCNYKYCVVIENCSYPNYWTEKLSDAILAGCYPIYFGDPNIYKYFDKDELTTIDISNFDESLNKIKSIMRDNLYEKRQTNIETARQKILYKYNMIYIIKCELDRLDNEINNNINLPNILCPSKCSIFIRIKKRLKKYFLNFLPIKLIVKL